jgi:hypothetical protein
MKPITKRRKRQKGEAVTFGSTTVKVFTRLRADVHGQGHRVWELDAKGKRRMFHDHGKAVEEAKRVAKLCHMNKETVANISGLQAARRSSGHQTPRGSVKNCKRRCGFLSPADWRSSHLSA